MRLFWITLLLIWAITAAPALLGFSPVTYGWMKYGHFIAVLFSVLVFVNLGRRIPKPGPNRLKLGFWAGAASGLLGSATVQYLLHLPPAVQAFMAQLPHVPPAAAQTMLHLHLLASAILSALISAVLLGLTGAVATWWGGRVRPAPPAPETSEPRAG